MKKRVLVADDSITIQKVVELSLSESYEVRCAANGAQAIELFEDYGPDIVLCDALMPEKDGYEVCAFVKGHAQLRHTPVLMLHGAFESFDEARARDVGADETLTKPFDTQTLIDMVGKLLSQIAQPSAEAASQEEAPPQEVVAKVEEDVESAFEAFEEKAGPAEEPSAPEEPPEAEETMAIPVPTMQSLAAGDAPQAEPPKEAGEAAESEPSYRGETVAVPRRELAQALEEDKKPSEGATAGPEAPEESPAEAPGTSPAEAFGASLAESGAGSPAEDVASELDAELANMDFGGDEEPSPLGEAAEEPVAEAQEESPLEADVPSESAPAAEAETEAEEAAAPPLPSEPTLDVSQEAMPAESAPSEEAVKEPVETEAPARAEEEEAPILGEESAEQVPEAYYEPPQGVTEDDRAFAREMAESSSVSATEMLGDEAVKAPAEEPREEEQAPAAEEEKARTETEEMATSELLKEMGEPSARELLNEEEIQKVVERAVKRISEKVLREIAWEVVPDLAEVLIRKKIEEIEKDAEKKK
ncbi:MAG: response regulator [Acidobacteriota bacterium]|nr:MAG: response regulator [Acidobacteriota bacterium]